jgi:TrmH family RNA methyltransferase
VRAVGEALDAGAGFRFAVFSARLEAVPGGDELLEKLASAEVETLQIEEAAFERLSDTERSQGLLAVCAQPTEGLEILRPGGRYLVLDAVQDPGNVGTLVRAATAFGLDGVLALDGTVDPWGAKAVRASAGMVFRMPVVVVEAVDAAEALEEASVPILVAAAAGRDVGEVAPEAGWALLVGNEGGGPRRSLAGLAKDTVRVPMPGGAESLNAGVAGAILLFALTQEIGRG